MTETLAQYIEVAAAYAKVWGYLLIVVFMTIESSAIPFPSEVVMIPAGFLAARGGMSLGHPLADAGLSILAGVVGSLLGAYANYFVALKLGKPFLEKYGKYFFLPPPTLQRAEEIFLEYGAVATFVCRLLPAIRQLISIPAGVAKMPFGKFSLYTALGAGLWVTLLTWIGYFIGAHTAGMSYVELVHRGKDAVAQNMWWIAAGCVALFAGYVWLHKRIMRTKAPAPSPGS